MNILQQFSALNPRAQTRVATLKRFENGAWKAQNPKGEWLELIGGGAVGQSVFYDGKTRRIIEPAPDVEIWHEMEV